MTHSPQVRCVGAHRVVKMLLLLTSVVLLSSAPTRAQQQYVSRYDLFAGYTFLDSPKVKLFENGFHFQFGVRPKRWYSLGFDYSVSGGSLTLTPNLLTPAWQQQLGGLLQELALAGQLPAGYTVVVPAHSLTQNVTAGPQLAYRHFAKVTLFLRPDLGAIHEAATPHASDPITKLIVEALVPSGTKTDWTVFYGFGGGIDFLFSKHIALRVQADLVYDHLFSDILQDGRLTTRFSVGPCFNFGKNIKK